MGEVSFEETRVQSPVLYGQPQEKGLIGWLIKNKIAKDKKQASMILLGVLVVVSIVTVIIWQMSHKSVAQSTTDPVTRTPPHNL